MKFKIFYYMKAYFYKRSSVAQGKHTKKLGAKKQGKNNGTVVKRNGMNFTNLLFYFNLQVDK